MWTNFYYNKRRVKEVDRMKQINFIDPHKFKSIKELDNKCRLQQWSINYNKQHIVNGFNLHDYCMEYDMKIAHLSE